MAPSVVAALKGTGERCGLCDRATIRADLFVHKQIFVSAVARLQLAVALPR
jgi:hypothetical protein